MNILLPGLYPRSEALVQASRDLERRRISREELAGVRRRDAEAFRTLQGGFSYLSSGLFAWQDLLRPFAEILKGCRVKGLKRFYETNTFYRLLEFEDPVTVNEGRLEDWIKTYLLADGIYEQDARLIVTMPFIYLFREYSQGLSLRRIGELLTLVAERLATGKNKMLVFFEASFGYRTLDEGEKRMGVEFIEGLRSRLDAPLWLYNAFFPVRGERDYLFQLPVDGIGVDFYNNPLAEIIAHFPRDKQLLAGILNTLSTLIEPQEMMARFIKGVREVLPADKLYLTMNGPADLLTRSVADAKVKNLRETLNEIAANP